MIYIKCPSCGLLLGNRQIVYEKGLNEINSNPNVDVIDKKPRSDGVVTQVRPQAFKLLFVCRQHSVGLSVGAVVRGANQS